MLALDSPIISRVGLDFPDHARAHDNGDVVFYLQDDAQAQALEGALKNAGYRAVGATLMGNGDHERDVRVTLARRDADEVVQLLVPRWLEQAEAAKVIGRLPPLPEDTASHITLTTLKKDTLTPS